MISQILTMDALTVATVVMAVGTIILAIVTYKNVNIAQKQLKAFQKQTILLLTQNQPFLAIDHFSFTENKFTAIIKNLNEAFAIQVAIRTYFFPMQRTQFVRVKSAIPGPEHSDVFNKAHQVFHEDHIRIYIPDASKKLKVLEKFPNSKKDILVHPDGGIIQLTRSESKSNYIKGLEENISFSCEPLFHCSNLNDVDKELINTGRIGQYRFSKKEKTFSKGYSFSELKELMLKHDIKAIMVSFGLVSKDLMENVTPHDNFSAFIVDFETDKSLEDASKNKYLRKIEGLTYNYSEMLELMRGYLPDFMYDNVQLKNYEYE